MKWRGGGGAYAFQALVHDPMTVSYPYGQITAREPGRPGPWGFRQSLDHSEDQAAYFEARSAEGVALADGLYTYEAWTEPKVLVTRSADDPRAGRDAGLKSKTMSDIDTVSGSFRVVDGQIVDAGLQEAPVAGIGGGER